jgi:hypothetical protein
MPPRSERPFEEKSRCWFEKCILPISLFTVPKRPNTGISKMFSHRSGPCGEAASGTALGETLTSNATPAALTLPDSSATSSDVLK